MCECKELIDKGVCNNKFIWNPSICECECDKSCDIAEYLDYEKCKCSQTLVDKIIGECNKSIDETRLVEKTSAENEHENNCSSCILYIILFSIFFIISIGITNI